MVDESHPDRFVDSGLISLVIPVFNEHESLPSLMAEIDAVSKSQNLRVEVLFVDDGSTDQSWDVIRDMSTKEPRIRGVRFRGNFGKAAALQAGFQQAHGDIVLTLDADLQDDPHEILRRDSRDGREQALDRFTGCEGERAARKRATRGLHGVVH